MQARTASIAVGCLALALAGLAGSAKAAVPVAGTETVLDQGEATWYGPRHEGLRTYNGERFDSHKMTAAHPSLPMGTMVRVTDVGTGRSIIVRVNDREPPHGVRCIDLSEGAALALGIHGRGVAEVTLTAVPRTDLTDEAPVEVAEAPDGPRFSGFGAHHAHAAIAQHGRRHRRRGGR